MEWTVFHTTCSSPLPASIPTRSPKYWILPILDCFLVIFLLLWRNTMTVLITVLLLWWNIMTKATQRRRLIGSLLLVSRGLVYYHHGMEHGDMFDTAVVAESYILIPGIRRNTGPGVKFLNFSAHPSDLLPLTRPHLPILLKQFHQLSTNYPNIWAHGGNSH